MKKLKFSFKLSPHFFSMIVIAIAVVLVWRGLWNIMDMYFFPNYPMISNIISIVVGLFLLYLPDEDIKELM